MPPFFDEVAASSTTRGSHLASGAYTPELRRVDSYASPCSPDRVLAATFTADMAMAGVPLNTVGDILGHRTSAMTERYSHLTPEHKKLAVEMLPEWGAVKGSGNILVTT